MFQIAAHEDVVPVPELYRFCEIAYEMVVDGLGLGRVIARPFVGTSGHYTRTAHRHDYAMPPRRETLLDRLTASGVPVVAIGKIRRSVRRPRHPARHHDEERRRPAWTPSTRRCSTSSRGLVFVNLVDFDTQYGHRNDVAGYAANLERFDHRLASVLPRLRADDLLVITADHGNDPTTPSTDHAREHVPLLVTGPEVAVGTALGTRATFADLGQTVADNFGVGRAGAMARASCAALCGERRR